MIIDKDISIIDLSLYDEKNNILYISDLHLGFEEELNRRGVLIPRWQLKDELQQLEKIFKQIPKKLDAVVINGDLKHEHGRISDQEWREILRLFDFLAKHAEKTILVKGNHDNFLAPIARKRDLTVVDYFAIDDIYVMHGHEIPENDDFKKAKRIIIGNEHPAIAIQDEVRSELYKCFLKGSWKKKQIIVLPSFNPMTIGTDVIKGTFLSPILKDGVSKYDVFIIQDKVYEFGTVESLSRL